MIKIIATDMDGTLLDSQKNVPKELDYVLDKLDEKKVRFIVASGRQYYNLEKQFRDYKHDLIYISENGAMVFDKGEIVYLSEIDGEKLTKPVEIARKIHGASIILCGEKMRRRSKIRSWNWWMRPSICGQRTEIQNAWWIRLSPRRRLDTRKPVLSSTMRLRAWAAI